MSDDADFLAISEKDIFDEAKERLKIAQDADTDNRKLAKEDALFREGLNHWNTKGVNTVSQESPELVINFTDTLVGRVVNSIAEREPRGKCHPVGDGADVQTADLINGIGRHIEYRSEASVAYDNAVDNAVTFGWGWIRLLIEYAAADSFDKEIRIAMIQNANAVFCDPAAVMPTASDMNWALCSFKMPRTEYVRLNPGVEVTPWVDIGDDELRDDWESKTEIRLAEYFRIREKTEKLYRIRCADPQTGEVRLVTSFASEMPSDEDLAKLGAKVIDSRESSKREVQWFKLNGSKVIDRAILPGEYIPLIRCEGNARNIDGKVYRRGMMRFLQDPQRMVDYGETAKIKRLGLSPQSPWVAAEGQLEGHPEWGDDHIAPRKVLTYKPVTIQTAQGEIPLPPPQRQPPAQVEQGFAELTEGMRSNLLAIAGMPNEPGQDTTQGVSGKALQRRDKLSDQSHSQYYKKEKLMIAHAWRIMLSWIPSVYAEDRMQRIVGEDGIPAMVRLNETVEGEVKNDPTVGRFDVVMDAGPSYETKREEGSAALMEIAGSPGPLAEILAKVAPDLLFRGLDVPYATEIADRLTAQTPDGLKKIMESLPKEAQAVVQSLASENANLKKALEAAQQEVKFGITKAHIAATVKAHDVEETNKTRRADTESRERTAIQKTILEGHTDLAVEEIKAGASLLNTHTEAKYHEREAEKVIETASRAEGTA